MQAALVVHRIVPDVEANLASIIDLTGRAAGLGADLALFPEAALTGLINNDEPNHDLALGQSIPGTATDRLGAAARAHGIWLAIGLLERAGGQFFDTAVLFNPRGEMALKYRRIQPQWHGRHADPRVYCQGTEIGVAETPFGTMAFLICGDLFDDEIVQRVRALSPRWLLFPFARCFDDGTHDQARWDSEERPEYVARVKMTGTTALMANYLAGRDLHGGAFGGAMCVSGSGQLLTSLPLGREGMLLVDLQVP